MPRSMSTGAKAAVFVREFAGLIYELLTIDHESLGTPIRLVRNDEDVTSRGDLFIAYPFRLTLPTDEDGRPGPATLVLDIIDRTILSAVGSINSPPDVLIEYVLSSTPDTVEMVLNCTWGSTTFTATQMQAELKYDDRINQGHPKHAFTPANFPSLF